MTEPEKSQRSPARKPGRAATLVVLTAAAAALVLGVVLLRQESARAPGPGVTSEPGATRAPSEPAPPEPVPTGATVLTANAAAARPVTLDAPDAATPAAPRTVNGETTGGIIPGIPSRSLPTHPLIFHHPDAATPPPN